MSLKKIKWIVVTGGNLSGLGKGIVSASIAKLLEPNKVINVKCDGYMNVDPGTINPYQHGEVYVLEDGGEVDMDFGHYERFTGRNSKFSHNLTSGKIFDSVISRERKGEYLGETVQIFPHVIEEIKKKFYEIASEENPDVMMIEIGGTIDDIEESWFIRAVREMKNEVNNMIFVHLAYAPVLSAVGEQKTRLIQTSVESLQSKGINPDIIVCRAEQNMGLEAKLKVSKSCGIRPENVISDPHSASIYELPLIFEKEGLRKVLEKKLGISMNPDLEELVKYIDKTNSCQRKIKVGICGKYTGLRDSYASIIESLNHAGVKNDVKVMIEFIDTTSINDISQAETLLSGLDGILIPGGFGKRGVEGKILACRYARENNVPYLGLCLGLQIAVIEYARNVCGLAGANSTEFVEEGVIVTDPVIDILPEQLNVLCKGGTMRKGSYEAELKENTLVYELYQKQKKVSERHRHRYEVNPAYHHILSSNGVVFSGTSANGKLVEFIELPHLRFFIATQAHPEFKSRPGKPAPLFDGFVKACIR